jgi:DNA primase large subunit
MAARPAESLEGIESLIGDSRIAALQQDQGFWAQVEGGSVDAALDRESFLAVQEDEGLRQRFAELGFVDGTAAERAEAFRAAMRQALESVGPRLRELRNHPQVRALVDDPEVAERLRSGESVTLLSDARFRGLVADVASGAR